MCAQAPRQIEACHAIFAIDTVSVTSHAAALYISMLIHKLLYSGIFSLVQIFADLPTSPPEENFHFVLPG